MGRVEIYGPLGSQGGVTGDGGTNLYKRHPNGKLEEKMILPSYEADSIFSVELYLKGPHTVVVLKVENGIITHINGIKTT